jgi:transglutaminase-like putative cysteine protease
MMALAHLNLVLGDRAESERSARRLLEIVDERPNSGDEQDAVWRRLATAPEAAALTLLGEHDAAIDRLEEDAKISFHWRWWYAFDREPVFDELRADPRFQALAAKAHAHADAERARLAEMRKKGQVPVRVADTAPGPGDC